MVDRSVETVVDLHALNRQQWRDLEQCASRLEAALQGGAETLDLRKFLPPFGAPHRLAVLYELIKTEFEARYLRGDRCLLEEYLRRYPELGHRDLLPASMIHEEFYVRQRFGVRPLVKEYRKRFPVQFETFCRLAHVDADDDSEPIELQELVGYTKLEILGRGKFGEVWKALAPGGVEVALKFVECTIDRELQALERIKQLRHSHLLQTHSFGMMEGKLTIVMEMADASLADRYKQCKDQGLPEIPKDWLVTYFKQAAEALDYLRRQKVSHCDIKPQNLLIQQGLAKVADFGFARAQDNRVEPLAMMVGTPYYMAPEMCNQQISHNSDQYSLAATYVHMRLGRPLFHGSMHELVDQHMNADPDLRPMPAAEQAVLKMALAKEPDRRYPSCVAFVKSLEEATKPPPPTPKAPPSPHRGLIALSAVLIIALIALVFLNRTPPVVKPDWQPAGWEPENAQELVKDRNGRNYYRRLVKTVGGQKIVMVAVPRLQHSDPPTFYIMENKVWNELYGEFYPHSAELFEKYSSRTGCKQVVSDQPHWVLGAWADNFNPNPDGPPFLRVYGAQGHVPVYRVTATDAHCFAEWLDPRHGRLPSRQQWLKAAGKNEDERKGPFEGSEKTVDGLAVKQFARGPWPIEEGIRDVSIYGIRQMASNGFEWTRDVQDNVRTIPLERMGKEPPQVYFLGQGYRQDQPLTFVEMNKPQLLSSIENNVELSFRVVLEE